MGKSSSSEDYMKVILILHKRKALVRSVDIAEEMGVTKPSVSNAMKKLREEKIIGVNKDTADKEACLMEHAISDETYECLGEFINAHGGEAYMENKM